jgi:hypothetical protein
MLHCAQGRVPRSEAVWCGQRKFYTASAQGAPSVDFGVASQADLVANIADLVNRGVIAGIADVRDESDRTGMRVVVEARTGSAPEVPFLPIVTIPKASLMRPAVCALWARPGHPVAAVG